MYIHINLHFDNIYTFCYSFVCGRPFWHPPAIIIYSYFILFSICLVSFIYGPSSLPCNSVAGCCRGDHGVRVRDVLACRAQCSANTACFAAKLYMSIGLLKSTVLVLPLLLPMVRRQVTEKKSSGALSITRGPYVVPTSSLFGETSRIRPFWRSRQIPHRRNPCLMLTQHRKGEKCPATRGGNRIKY